MPACPVCKGSGKQTLTATNHMEVKDPLFGLEPGTSREETITCIWCGGDGEITLGQNKLYSEILAKSN